MQRDFMNSLANRRSGSMQVTQTTTTSGGSSSSGGMSAGGSSVSGSINGGSTSSSGSTGAGGEWFTRETEQDGCVTMTRLHDACATGIYHVGLAITTGSEKTVKIYTNWQYLYEIQLDDEFPNHPHTTLHLLLSLTQYHLLLERLYCSEKFIALLFKI